MTTDVLLPWIHAAGGDGERKSMQAFHGDGTTGPWSFTFAGGYIDRAHVKAYRYDPVSATAHPQTLTFLGANQIKTTDPIPAGQYIVIYRDTPKDKPLVDYNEGAVLTEKNLDTTAEQAVFAAAEMVDRFDTINTTSNEAIERSVLALDTANAALSNSNTAMADAADSVTTAAWRWVQVPKPITFLKCPSVLGWMKNQVPAYYAALRTWPLVSTPRTR